MATLTRTNDSTYLRGAILAANAKPGLDRILIDLPFTDEIALDSDLGQIEITESLEIASVHGPITIRVDNSHLDGDWIPNSDLLRLRIPPDNGNRVLTIREVAEFINRQNWPFTASVDGDGSRRFDLNEYTLPSTFSGGGDESPATATFQHLTAGDGGLTIYAPIGLRFNSVSITTESQRTAPRSRIFQFGGPGNNTYTLTNVNLEGGNGRRREPQSVDFDGNNPDICQMADRDLFDQGTGLHTYEREVRDGVFETIGTYRSDRTPQYIPNPNGPAARSCSALQVSNHFQNGDVVTYTALGGSEIVGLTSGQDYRIVNTEQLRDVFIQGTYRQEDIFYLTPVGSDNVINITGAAADSHHRLEQTEDARDGLGGAVLMIDSDDKLVLNQVAVKNNFATRSGGGIYIDGGELELNDSVVEGNYANRDGGGIFGRLTDITINRSTVESNVAESAGGGISLLASDLSVVDSAISENIASQGPGVYVSTRNNGTTAFVEISGSRLIGNRRFDDSPLNVGIVGPGSSLVSLGNNIVHSVDGVFDQTSDHLLADEVMEISPVFRNFFPDDTEIKAPAGVFGGSIARVRLNVPIDKSTVRYEVDDPRFEVVGGELKLKPNSVLPSARFDNYQVTITAVDALNGRYRQTMAFRSFVQPGIPRGLNAPLETTSDNATILFWMFSEAGSEDRYRIYQVDGSEERLLAVVDGFRYDWPICGLEPSTTYSFFVEAVSPAGVARTETLNVTTRDRLPTFLRDLYGEAKDSSTVQLNWTDVDFEDGYRIMHNNTEIATLPANTQQFEITNLPPESTQLFSVVPFNASGLSTDGKNEFDTVVAVELSSPAPDTPVDFRAEVLSGGNVRLHWSNVQRETNYIVFHSRGDGKLEEIARLPADSTSFDVNGVTDGRDRFVVTANNSGGTASSVGLEGEFTGEVMIDTIAHYGGDVVTDLSSLVSAQFVDVTTLDLSEGAASVIRVDGEDIRTISASDSLLVLASIDDQLVFENGWEFVGAEIQSGRYTRVVAAGGAFLILDRPDQWRNPLQRMDVNADATVSALDALIVVNRLARDGVGELPVIESADSLPSHFFDVNGDHAASAIDALLIINALARQSGGESEVHVFSSMQTTPSRESNLTTSWATTVPLNSKRFVDHALHGRSNKVISVPQALGRTTGRIDVERENTYDGTGSDVWEPASNLKAAQIPSHLVDAFFARHSIGAETSS